MCTNRAGGNAGLSATITIQYFQLDEDVGSQNLLQTTLLVSLLAVSSSLDNTMMFHVLNGKAKS